jgi:hypothetical protein
MTVVVLGVVASVWLQWGLRYYLGRNYPAVILLDALFLGVLR